MRRWPRILALALALAAIVVALWLAARRPPSWWSPPLPTDDSAVALAENFERRLSEELSRVRESDAPWAVRLSEEQLNAWLALRMPRWIEHAGAPLEAEAQVHVLDGSIEVAVRPLTRVAGRTVAGPVGVVTLVPSIADGSIRASVESAGVGAIGLPGPAKDAALRTMDSLLRAFAERRAADDGASSAPVGESDAEQREADLLAALLRGESTAARWPLGDGRSVDLLDLELRRGEILLQCRTRRTP